MNGGFKYLFTPVHIGSLEISNRIVMSGMCTNFASDDGHVTAKLKDYYEARARGGVGLVTVEASCIDLVGQGLKTHLMIHDDEFIPGLSDLSRTVKAHGAKIAIQIVHAGVGAKSMFNGGRQPVAPSPVARTGGEMPRELKTSEVEDLVSRFASAAERAQKALRVLLAAG